MRIRLFQSHRVAICNAYMDTHTYEIGCRKRRRICTTYPLTYIWIPSLTFMNFHQTCCNQSGYERPNWKQKRVRNYKNGIKCLGMKWLGYELSKIKYERKKKYYWVRNDQLGMNRLNWVRNNQIENKSGYEMTKLVRNDLGTNWPRLDKKRRRKKWLKRVRYNTIRN